ncbi:MAG: DivIVA domain-containing protein [Eubacteriales bacterium]|nr:DivIVA domain-containing protein [Eubacteriales bacterium]
MIRVEEIANKDFKSVIWGYDPESVDSFLDQIIEVILQMQAERKEMTSTIDYLVNELAAVGRKPMDGAQSDSVVEPMAPEEI